VGAQAASQRDGFLVGRCFTDDADLAAGRQQRPNASAKQRLTSITSLPLAMGGRRARISGRCSAESPAPTIR
jgi:hypothetical protein